MKWHKLVYPVLAGAILLGSAMVLPAIGQNPPQDNVPGSFLVFPVFDIRSGGSTTIRITDTMGGNISGNGDVSVGIHVDYVCKGSNTVNGTSATCDERDQHFTLTHHETLEIHVEENLLVPGCEEGYVVVFAEDPATGNAISYNNLIGSWHVGNGGDNAFYGGNAIAFQSTAAFNAALGTTAPVDDPQLTFGTTTAQDYVALPRYLHSTFQAAEPDVGSKLELVLLTLNVDSGISNPKTNVTIYYWDADEHMQSTPWGFYCWGRVNLAELDGHFKEENFTEWGSLKVIQKNGKAVLGVVIETGTGDPKGVGPHGIVARNTQHVGENPAPFVTTFHPE